ncbi:IclR family transcriptional regulator [Streptomyces sp. NRRL F-5065]|uniref:IclR family transcriptional regulator n=1 Tax=Streptomyces sp. NRRL F-5065 TaxID=1463855 RepID=UPI00131CF846|nr:IclR family transcriptional regulator [Streptomyces sp. NRRL F-5065]
MSSLDKRTAERGEPSGGSAGPVPKSVAARTLRILDTFDSDHCELSLSNISRRSGLPVATCHRLVGELVEWGGLLRTGSRYRIGHKLWSLGLLSESHHGLAELAAPYMHDVLFLTKHVVNLFVLDGDQALLLERISGTQPGRALHRVGDRLALHASAGGKAFLAYGPPELAGAALANPQRLTPNTVTDPTRLRRELEQVRRKGYAVTLEEAVRGAHGIAVPVTAADGSVLAALGVVTVGTRPRPAAIVPVLQIAARSIAREAGRLAVRGGPAA